MSALLFIFIICAPTVLTQDSTSLAEHYCVVQSPIDLTIFNLTTIQLDDIDSTIRLNEFEHLRVHFCQPLKEPCNGKQDYAVCLHSNEKEIGVGKEPPDVAIEFGKIMFRYTGDTCNETHNYTVDVEMKCNFYNRNKIRGDLDIVYNRDQCSFQMSIETFAACSKRKQTKCDFKGTTGYYDFSPLINEASNYVINLNNSISVILNVCQSLLYGKHSHQCDDDTTICLVDETNPEEPRYKSLASVNGDIRFSTNNGIVHMYLTSDTRCYHSRAIDTPRVETIKTAIEFVCQTKSTNTLPKYVSGLGTCLYKFRWPTVAACSEDKLIRLNNIEQQPCKITDEVHNLYYDLSTIAGHIAFVNSSDEKAEYQFSVCAPLQVSNCTNEGTGVCKYIKGKNIAVSKGQANANLMWRREYIYLNYTDGIACGNNQRSYTVFIFKCSRTNSTVLVDDHDPCATIITWTSSTVCKCTYDIERLMSVLQPENLYHWRLLSRHHANYVVQEKYNAIQYHLNVGTPLVEDRFTTCTDDTGICKVVVDNEGKRISELKLGSQDPDTHFTGDGDMYLLYLNGSICEEDGSKNISTKITFTCDYEAHAVKDLYYNLDHRFPSVEFLVRFLRIVQGTPTFNKYSNCRYEFNWKTTHACLADDSAMSDGCRTTENTVDIFNFTYLIENSLFKVNIAESAGYFNARYCKNKLKCNGTFICGNWPYYGTNLKTKPDFTKPLIVFKFANESACEMDTYYNTVINVWCGLWEGIAESLLLKEDECSIGLDWDKYITACHLIGRATYSKEENNNENIPPTDSGTIPPTDSGNIPQTNSGKKPRTGRAELHPIDVQFVETASIVFLVSYTTLLSLLGLGILIYCYGHKFRRVLRINNRRNYENNIRYITMREQEPVVDLNLHDDQGDDRDEEPADE